MSATLSQIDNLIALMATKPKKGEKKKKKGQAKKSPKTSPQTEAKEDKKSGRPRRRGKKDQEAAVPSLKAKAPQAQKTAPSKSKSAKPALTPANTEVTKPAPKKQKKQPPKNEKPPQPKNAKTTPTKPEGQPSAQAKPATPATPKKSKRKKKKKKKSQLSETKPPEPLPQKATGKQQGKKKKKYPESESEEAPQRDRDTKRRKRKKTEEPAKEESQKPSTKATQENGNKKKKAKKSQAKTPQAQQVKSGVFMESDLVGLEECDLSKFEEIESGMLFLCNYMTEKEVFEKKLFGSPESHFEDMQKITDKTALFLYRIDRYNPVMHGVFVRDGPAQMKIDEDAWGGRFPAQIRFKPFFRFPNPLPEHVLWSIFKDTNRSRLLARSETHQVIAEFYNHRFKDHSENNVLRNAVKKHEALANRYPSKRVLRRWTSHPPPVAPADIRDRRQRFPNKFPLEPKWGPPKLRPQPRHLPPPPRPPPNIPVFGGRWKNNDAPAPYFIPDGGALKIPSNCLETSDYVSKRPSPRQPLSLPQQAANPLPVHAGHSPDATPPPGTSSLDDPSTSSPKSKEPASPNEESSPQEAGLGVKSPMRSSSVVDMSKWFQHPVNPNPTRRRWFMQKVAPRQQGYGRGGYFNYRGGGGRGGFRGRGGYQRRGRGRQGNFDTRKITDWHSEELQFWPRAY